MRLSPKALLTGSALLASITAGIGLALWQATPAASPKLATATTAFIPSLDNTAGFPSLKSGNFSLIDQNGLKRTSRNPNGEYQLLFFGYAKCNAICSVALPSMAEATDVLAGMGHNVTPVMITVDPKRDTVAALSDAMPRIHSKMVGLTGGDAALQEAYDAFQVKSEFIFDHPDEGAVYNHASHVYLLDPNGNFRTLLPPITTPARIAEVAAGYIAEDIRQGG